MIFSTVTTFRGTLSNTGPKSLQTAEPEWELAPDHCSIHIHVGLMAIVVVSHTVKVLCLFFIFKQTDFEPLVTLGDAINSFMRRPEPETKDCGPISEDYVLHSQVLYSTRCSASLENLLQKHRRASRRFWWFGVTSARWLITLSM